MKKSTFIKRTALILAFVLVLGALAWAGSYILKMKSYEGILTMQHFYAQPENSCDVLVLGSSHSGMNMDMSLLWNDYGIPAFCLWGPVQPYWNSYHNLVEALKTQTPKVIVMEVYGGIYPEEYSEATHQQMNIVGMRHSRNRLEATMVTAPRDQWLNLILEYPLFHNRISQLTLEDFDYFPWSKGLENDKGTQSRYGGYTEGYLPNAADVTEVEPIHEKAEVYLRKIIETCKQENIPLVLLKTPSVKRDSEQRRYNYIEGIAREYGLSLMNMNLMDDQTGITVPDYWHDGHMNTNGARKVTRYLGEYLTANYALEDHRGDPAYGSWDIFTQNVQKDYLAQITGSADYAKELVLQGYTTVLVKNGIMESDAQTQPLLEALAPLGLPENFSEAEGCWVIPHSREAWQAQEMGEEGYAFDYNGDSFSVNMADTTTITAPGGISVSFDSPGIYLLAYNEDHGYTMDIVGLLKANQYSLSRS